MRQANKKFQGDDVLLFRRQVADGCMQRQVLLSAMVDNS
jgi:hypothetical protein